MAEAPPLPTTPSDSSLAAAVPRSLPPTLILPPTSSSGSQAVRGGVSGRSAAGSKTGKARTGLAPLAVAEGGRHDRLVQAVRVVGRSVDSGVAGADILELAMAKGPMFSWLSYWPEEGYPKEDQPY